MKKYFISSDVHSFFTPWKAALDEAGFDVANEDHIIILCGDLFDRGDETIECLEFICNMLDHNRAICIKGNHEDLFEKLYERGYVKGYDIHNGTEKTFLHLYNNIHPTNAVGSMAVYDYIHEAYHHPLMQKYLNSLVDYYETEKYIFTHSWIPYNKDWRNGDWDEAMWCNPYEKWSQGTNTTGKTIVSGHWHTSYGHSYFHNIGVEFSKTGRVHTGIFKDDGFIGLDACTVLSHRVNILTLSRGMKKCC